MSVTTGTVGQRYNRDNRRVICPIGAVHEALNALPRKGCTTYSTYISYISNPIFTPRTVFHRVGAGQKSSVRG